MIIIITIVNFFFFWYTFHIFAVNKSNKVIHSKETNINFITSMLCVEKATNIFQFPNE